MHCWGVFAMAYATYDHSSQSVTSQDLAVLQCSSPDWPSGYVSVYPHRDKWIPKCFGKAIGPVQPNPRDAARLVVLWWRENFGPRWPAFFSGRKCQGFLYSKKPDGIRVVVFLMGVPHTINQRKPCNTHDEARSLLIRWKRRRYGLFLPYAGLEMRRAYVPVNKRTQQIHQRVG